MWGSSSSSPAQTFGSSSSCPRASFGPTRVFSSAGPWDSTQSWTGPAFGVSHTSSPSESSCLKGLSEKGSRVSSCKQTADDASLEQYYNLYLQSISAMPVYSSKSHEELRHEDYQIGDKGGTYVSSPPSSVLGCWSSPAFSSRPPTRSSTQGSNCCSNPFWLPTARLQSPLSSGDLQSSKKSLSCASTSSLSFSVPIRSAGVQTPPVFHIPSNHPCTEFQKDPASHSPTSLAIPCTAHGETLLGTGANTASVTTSSTKPTATLFCPNFSTPTFEPTARQQSVLIDSGAASYTTWAEATSTQRSIFNQKVSTTTTQSGTSSSAAHSGASLSPDVHCASIKVDYPNNTAELLLPFDISLVRIRFSTQIHSDNVAKASETPISISIYPGENKELTIQSIEQPSGSEKGKQSYSTSGPCPNDQTDYSRVCNGAVCLPSSGSICVRNGSVSDAQLTQKAVTVPDCEVITGNVLPRLTKADYYTIPSIVELAVRESDEPGYCSRVQDFTVGRYGYGSIKFTGETDVRKLDIASIVEFNNREILMYRDESTTPPAGQELNKPAEVTLLNVKCVDQRTGLQFTEGPMVDRYKEVLVQWTKEHDAEFVSFHPAKGEWKFKVKNFSL